MHRTNYQKYYCKLLSDVVYFMRYNLASKQFYLLISTQPHYLMSRLVLSAAFSTRLFSVLRFESVIHEFDP